MKYIKALLFALSILVIGYVVGLNAPADLVQAARERLSVLCATESGNCLESWNGGDIVIYSDRGTTQKFHADGATGAVTLPYNIEHIGVPSIITATVPYTPATGTVATVADGEIWLVHSVFIKTNTNFDCTGNDCTLQIGDGNDANGFISAVDANIQAAFTEATGYTAGFYGLENGSGGAYTLDDGGPFVYAPSGAAETIDYAIGGTDPTAGSATAYIVYTRIQ